MKRVVCASLILFASISLLSADYYVVESNGDAYPVEKTAKRYERISDRPSFTSSFCPGHVDTVYYFDPDIEGWYYPNRDSNTVVLFLFNSEYACSLIAVGIHYYSPEYAELYVWEGPDPIPSTTAELEAELNATWDYDTLTNNWDSWPTVLYGPQLIGSTEPGDHTTRTCWHELEPHVDTDTSAVWVGYRIVTHYNPDGTPYGGKPWPLSDNWVDPHANPPRFVPCRSWMYREQPGVSTDNQWIEYGDITGDWEFFFVIDIYVNDPPRVLSFDKLPGTYDTGDRAVTAHIRDFGVPAESSGVAYAWLFYYLNDAPGTVDSSGMVLIEGTIDDGMWQGAIPGQANEAKITYYISCTDLQGLNTTTVSEVWSYHIRKGTPGHMLLLAEDDAYYGSPYSHDPVSSVTSCVDVWNERLFGSSDSSVLWFYHPSGPGQPIIFWFTYRGSHFWEELDFLSSFFDAGGKLFLSSQDLVYEYPGGYWNFPPGHFVREYLKATSGDDDYYIRDSIFHQYGVPGDTITGSPLLSEVVVYPYYWAGPGYNWAGRFEKLDSACVPIFRDSLPAVMGYRYEDTVSGYKVIWVYWPIQYIILTNGGIQDNVEAQDTLIARTLQWFGYQTEIEEKTPHVGVMLLRAAPNPLTERAIIQYGLVQRSRVDIVIYNLLGEHVKTLVETHQEAGLHTITWDATDNAARRVPSGTYFLRLEARAGQAGNCSATRKVCVVR